MRMRRLLAIAVVIGTLGVVTAAPVQAGDVEPRLLDRECDLLIPSGVQADCHWLVVPESRAGRGRVREVRLAVMVLHAKDSAPELDPTVFLSGGPGDAGIAGFENFLESPMLVNRDLVLFDQRGTGQSEPLLNCPEREAALRVDLARAESHDVELEALREATRACRDRLVDEEKVNLDAYDTRESAADVADLRVALGYEEWNLYGISYGTRLALETMRSHPEGIRSVVLDSVYPTDVVGVAPYIEGVETAFDRLVAACNADPSCSVQQANLAELIDQVVERYNTDPVALTAVNGDEFAITGDDALAGLWDAMYDSDLIPALPAFIEAIAAGDVGFLQVLAEEARFDLPAEGTFLSIECADGGEVDIPEPGRSSVVLRFAAQPYCDIWDVDRVPASFNRKVRSRIPTLVLAGSLDPITPAVDSKRTADALRNATYVEFAGLGHVVTIPSDCAKAIRQVFLEDPESELSDADLACAAEPAPPFLSQGLI